jgi:hypothetical protein
LNVDLIDVWTRIDVESNRERHGAVVGICRLYVERVIHAAHLLLERRGHGLFDRHRIGSGVRCVDDDLRRHNVRELGYRQSGHCD